VTNTATSDHNHDHLPFAIEQDSSPNRLLFVFLFTLTFFFVELIGGIISGSLALLADAVHMLQDVVALGLAALAVQFAKRPKNLRHTFGFKRAEVIAAFVNGISLLLVSGYIIYEALNRLNSPLEIETGLMFVVATVGLVINLIGLALLHKGSKDNLNSKGAFLHVLSDTLGSVGAIVASILIILTGMNIYDLIVSILITILILRSSVKLLTSSLHILMEGRPEGVNVEEIEAKIKELEPVIRIHDMHIWSLTTNKINLSCHVVVKNDQKICACNLIQDINNLLKTSYNITHTTIQIEHEEPCSIPNCGLC
jgi:cobalt-zinc-cadmium efflux system protein